MWALIPQNFIPLPRHVEDFEVEDKASVSRLGKVEEEGLYRKNAILLFALITLYCFFIDAFMSIILY